MRRLVYIAFLGLAIYHSLSLFPGMTADLSTSQASVKRSMNVSHFSSPFIQLRIPNSADLQGKIKFSFVSENQIRLNGHLFDLIGLSIFKGFIDLRIMLNNAETGYDLAALSKDFQSENGGVNFKSGPVFVPFTPPVVFILDKIPVSSVPGVPCPYLAENPLTGFEKIPVQPPRI